MTVRAELPPLDLPSARRQREKEQRGQDEQAKPNGSDPSPRPRIIKPIDFTALPEIEPAPRRFRVGGWLPIPCLSSCYGSGGIGKSLLAQLLATCVVTGRDFFGAAIEPAPVIGIFGEDDDEELERRQWRINQAFGLKFADLGKLHLEGAAGLNNILCSFPNGAPEHGPLYQALIDNAEQRKAGLIILDNRAQMFLGNENDRAVATYSGNLAAGLARIIKGAVLLLGHEAKADESEYSGSTAWDAVTRSRWWLHRLPARRDEDPQLVLERRKSNYAPPESVKLTWRNGLLAAADEQHMTPADRLERELRKGAARQAFLDALDKLTALGRTTSDSKQAQNYAPAFMVAEGLNGDFTRAELAQAMRELFADHVIEANVPLFTTTNRKRRHGIARVAAPPESGHA
jgi:RecA-family ATPase